MFKLSLKKAINLTLIVSISGLLSWQARPHSGSHSPRLESSPKVNQIEHVDNGEHHNGEHHTNHLLSQRQDRVESRLAEARVGQIVDVVFRQVDNLETKRLLEIEDNREDDNRRDDYSIGDATQPHSID